jgi:hypothetical protein
MDADTIARLRPAGRSVADLQGALDTLAQERVACERRAVAARADRTAALVAGAAWHVAAADKTMKAAADDLEMLDALEPALRERLAFAETVEARAVADLTEANEAAETVAAAFAAALPRYARHAQAIAEIARLGQAADQARHHAAALAAKQGLPEVRMTFPAGALTASPRGYPLSMASLVRLPAPDGSGLLVGTWGQEHQPVPAFRYAE